MGSGAKKKGGTSHRSPLSERLEQASEVTKIRPKVYSLASKSTLRHCNNEGQKRNSGDKRFLFFPKLSQRYGNRF